jgi:hypothetical protein
MVLGEGIFIGGKIFYNLGASNYNKDVKIDQPPQEHQNQGGFIFWLLRQQLPRHAVPTAHN